MTSWTGQLERSRVKQEISQRPPTPQELREKADAFQKNWSRALTVHWGLYFILFLSQFVRVHDFNITLVIVGFFSLFFHQAAFITSSGWLPGVIMKHTATIPTQRSVRVHERLDVTVSLDESSLRMEPLHHTATEISRAPIETDDPVDEENTAEPRQISLESGQVALDWVRDQDGTPVLEVRDRNVHQRIDLAGFDRSADPDAPRIDRDPIVLAPNDAEALRRALIFQADAHSIKVPDALR